MNKECTMIIFFSTFLLRLVAFCYMLSTISSDNIYSHRDVLLKIVVMNMYTFLYITFILMSHNLFQLRLHKIFLLSNMPIIHYILTLVGVESFLTQVYNILLLVDVLVEIYALDDIVYEFAINYSRRKGISLATYKCNQMKQKIVFCYSNIMLLTVCDFAFYPSTKLLYNCLIGVVLYMSLYKKAIGRQVLIGFLCIGIAYNQRKLLMCLARTVNKHTFAQCAILVKNNVKASLNIKYTKLVTEQRIVEAIVGLLQEVGLSVVMLYFVVLHCFKYKE